MIKEETKKKFEEIYRKYRETYDGDYFMYDCVNRDMLLSLCYAYDEGEVTEEEYMQKKLEVNKEKVDPFIYL